MPSAETVLPHDAKVFNPAEDLISLHYDHAPDKDDGQSAAADRTLLQAQFGADWIPEHVVAVSGTYGWLGGTFQEASDAVMDSAWSDVGGWLSANDDWHGTAVDVAELWNATLSTGGHVWVKEGGPSDFTAEVLEQLEKLGASAETISRIHVVQHATGNQVLGFYFPLRRVQASTDYRRIRGGNITLLEFGGDDAFVEAARSHAVVGSIWTAAFDYYDPEFAIDFSDSAATYHILGLGPPSLEDFRTRFLSEWADGDGFR
ncbi:hypothetical protein MK489_23210 [Myxococcota bacterium]|nr:hypothetical protein [Myxococcota bacterium]